ncbi:protein-L-isoaspartate O-methyltransferase [Archaeoglobus fulgidus]|uniref:Protein-L-isoaspartate O-methyltransferase 1 n=1 Tax=Archaeoglobus fulgidus (strain ATCC 49558 / DSM 4304 / JCM 9628 / NBRC 100126 / VC-16) TaxID=224325 RepID=PIMT1_ARCFU|nr:protein-L-isoaspartate O-methyltransferase [Archaeoglobus fulgidus]O30199.1 RecName: Full=Protein-L-isoaspartate O-methyltransferase 1; AltName: Full=L-isoaspartyl protein carboxyl methyltransferase 1; AltName: Full=Protein L-isoaspartyl methyltransferase 1; AltName: Full=Protein-beta-aspartate methyltransferase 1; Short=PIMT 1 [Archaeoglobus fulgidus DSM 4304]AAB91197.1 L-isoaspartyl protein carboxyl methyltransferase (pcm-1) [Archaeoglobus fulgidus DSM 4304]
MDFDEKRRILAERLRDELNLSEKVYNAIKKVPRHLFVPERYRTMAYVDTPLPIGYGQTISAPHMVAIMCELLDLREGERVLEIGTGCGYHAAVTAEIVGKRGLVVSVERIPELAEIAKRNLSALGYENVVVIVGDGSLGYEPMAPYDKIYVTASAPDIPKPLLEQLKIGGKMVIPIGETTQFLYVVERDNGVRKWSWGAVRFVPLYGKYGFRPLEE